MLTLFSSIKHQGLASSLRVFHLIMLSALLSACTQGAGCSGQEGYVFPPKDKVQSALQVRVTEPGFEILSSQITPLIEESLPPQLNTCLPGDQGTAIGIDWSYCAQAQCSDGQTGCEISINVGALELSAVEPSAVRTRVTLEDFSMRFDVAADPIIDCAIAIDGPGFPVDLDVNLSTPEPARNLTLTVQEANYNLSDLNVRFVGNDGFLSPLCDGLDLVLNLPVLRDIIFDLIEVVVDEVLVFGLQAGINELICLPCVGDADPQCLMEGGECVLGACLKPDLSCVPRPLGLEGQQDLGGLLSSFSPNLSAEVGYFLNPGSYAQTEEAGLSLGVITGMNATLNRCAPPAPQPSVEEPPRLSVLRGNVTPEGNPYDLGLGISQTILDHVLWSVHQSGLTCLTITTAQIAQLSPQTFTLLLPKLGEVTRGGKALAISLSPQVPPNGIIGSNRLGPPNADGVRPLEDPLLTLDWPELWIDFHAFMEDRWTRLFSLKVHLILPLGFSFDPSGGVLPLLGDLNMALTDVETLNDELLIDDPSRVATLLPTLLRPLLNSALGDPIALPDLLGVSIAPQEGSLRGLSEGDEPFITLFADLVAGGAQKSAEMGAEMGAEMSAEMGVEAQRARALSRWALGDGGFTLASAIEVQSPEVEGYLGAEALAQGAQVTPSVKLALSVDRAKLTALYPERPHAKVEFSWRVDEGPWRPYTTASELTVRDAALLVPGEHMIEVRARLEGDHMTLDPQPARVEVSLEATSQALIGRPDPNAAAEMSAGCACDQRSTEARAHATSPLWLLALALMLALKPRAHHARSRLAARLKRLSPLLSLLYVLLSALALSACDDTSKKPRGEAELCDEALCGPNQRCVENVCQVIGCASDSDCSALGCEGAAGVCNTSNASVGGVCECADAPLCPDGCAEREFCCFASNSCERPPAPCNTGDYSACPPGFELAATTRGEPDPNSCELVGEVCECIESTPLPLGSIGRYSDLDVHNGVAWVSAYSDLYGDLVVGRGTPNSELEWSWVDGVPESAPVVGSPSGPRAGVEEAGADVGAYTSLAVSAQGVVHVVYQDRDNLSLKYASARATQSPLEWRVETIDEGPNVGRWASLALSPSGAPLVVYRATPAEGQSEVRMLVASSAEPQRADWGAPVVLHSRSFDATQESLTYPEGTGLFNSVAWSPNGELAVAWYERSAGELMVVRGRPEALSAPETLAGWSHPTRTGDMGANVSLTFDAQGALHLCYQDGTIDGLRYLSPDLERDELVDDGLRLDVGERPRSLHVVGEDCSVHFDDQGRAVVLYQDATAHEVVVSRRDASGAWLRQVIRAPSVSDGGQTASGFYVQGSAQGSALWVSHYLYDHAIEPPMQRLELFATPFP